MFVDTSGNVIPAYVDEDDVSAFFDRSTWYDGEFRDEFHVRATNKEEEQALRAERKRLLDAQQNVETGNTVYSDFTEDEMYTLMQ